MRDQLSFGVDDSREVERLVERQASDAFQEALTEIFFDCHATPIPGLTRKYGVF